MYKNLLNSEEGHKKIQAGIDKIANTVKLTLGAKGRNVIFETALPYPTITNDGVTIAQEVTLEDPFERLGAQLIKEAARKTNDIAGDGTTTAVILAQAIYNEGRKIISAGANPMPIKRGIQKAVDSIVAYLKTIAKPVDDAEMTKQVASISANNDREIGDIISEAIEKTGKDGVVTVQESKTQYTILNCVEGLQFDKGYHSPYFSTNPNMTVELDNPYIVITDKTITNPKEVMPIINKITQESNKPFVLIADTVDGDALQTLIVNAVKGNISCVTVRSPEFSDIRQEVLEDIAVVTGGTVIDDKRGITLRAAGTGLKEADITHLGIAEKVVVSADKTTIIGGKGDKKKIIERIEAIRGLLKEEEDDFRKEKLKERLAKLTGGVAVIHAGATTETEMREKRMRIEDALNATKCAVEEGIVAGGGIALLKAIHCVDTNIFATKEEHVGVDIVRQAISKPFEQVVTNAGGDAGEMKALLKEKMSNTLGYDANDGEVKDMFKAGIIDPVKVTRTALQNAASIASMLLTTEAFITNIPEEKPTILAMPQM